MTHLLRCGEEEVNPGKRFQSASQALESVIVLMHRQIRCASIAHKGLTPVPPRMEALVHYHSLMVRCIGRLITCYSLFHTQALKVILPVSVKMKKITGVYHLKMFGSDAKLRNALSYPSTQPYPLEKVHYQSYLT